MSDNLIKSQYYDVNYKKRIRDFNKILSIGDVIRIKKTKNKWGLSQVPNVNGALISISSNSGAISALSGGYDFRLSKFNRATQALRQPGSAFKPFVYALALENNYTPSSLISENESAPTVTLTTSATP